MAVLGLVTEVFSLAFFKIHTHVRIFLLTEIFAKIPRSQGAGMEAFAMVSEEFCLAVFHFHTNRRNFLLTDDSAKNPDNCPFAEQLQSKNICWSLHIAGDSACNGTAINKTMRTCPAKIKKERKNSPSSRRVFLFIFRREVLQCHVSWLYPAEFFARHIDERTKNCRKHE